MTPIRYRALCSYAGDHLGDPLPSSIPIDEIENVTESSGVYIVCEPLERVEYVGSVCRPGQPGGVATRVREHLREGHKRLRWKSLWLVPLTEGTPIEVVRSVEACVGVDLGPLGGDRLPRL